jgi:hypothetical protein
MILGSPAKGNSSKIRDGGLTLPSAGEDRRPVSSWKHLCFFLIILALQSVFSPLYLVNLVTNGHGPFPTSATVSTTRNIAADLVGMAVQGLFVGYIWIGLRTKGLHLIDLVGGRWAGSMGFLKDIAIAVAFLLAALIGAGIFGRILERLLGWHPVNLPSFLIPRNPGELVGLVGFSITAGFCEELMFRGYLQRQFIALTKNRHAAVFAQAAVFGLAHSYQGRLGASVSTLLGFSWGWLAIRRNSLRPGMLAHGLMDAITVTFRFLR